MFGNPYNETPFNFTRLTQNANTVIDRVIPPKPRFKVRLTTAEVLNGSTAHTLTLMRALGKTTLSAAALAAQAVINLVADPGAAVAPYTGANAIAAADYVVIEKPDGSFHLGKVSSVATLAITLTANVPTGGFASGADVWFFGVPADTGHQQRLLTASVRNTIQDIISGIFTAGAPYGEDPTTIPALMDGYNEPVIVSVNNATAQSFLERVDGYYAFR